MVYIDRLQDFLMHFTIHFSLLEYVYIYIHTQIDECSIYLRLMYTVKNVALLVGYGWSGGLAKEEIG